MRFRRNKKEKIKKIDDTGNMHDDFFGAPTTKLDIQDDPIYTPDDPPANEEFDVVIFPEDHNCADHCGHVVQITGDELKLVGDGNLELGVFNSENLETAKLHIQSSENDDFLKIDYEDDGFSFAKFMKDVLKIKKYQGLADKYGITFTFAEELE